MPGQITKVGAARAYTDAVLGGPTYDIDSNPTAQTTAGELIKGSPDRVGLIIVNQGGNDVYVAISSGVSTTNGIKLTANGGSVTMDVKTDYTLPSRAWFAIANGGTSACYVIEIVRSQYTPASEA